MISGILLSILLPSAFFSLDSKSLPALLKLERKSLPHLAYLALINPIGDAGLLITYVVDSMVFDE